MKPMLAVNAEPDKIRYPVWGSPKLDGVRCIVHNGDALSRTLKKIPNRHIFNLLSREELNGLDGELVVGHPTASDVYTQTVSGVMAHDGEPDFTYYVFDYHASDEPWRERFDRLMSKVYGKYSFISVLPHRQLSSAAELAEYEASTVETGYEGVILRDPAAPYKYGRSTAREGYLLKCKRFLDSEAEIVGFIEEMFNGNEATTNELGRTKRSTAKAGLTGKNTLGAFKVRDLKTGVEFCIGTGLTAHQRADAWRNRAELQGQLVRYKYFPVGVKDAPRHPVFTGFRHKEDM